MTTVIKGGREGGVRNDQKEGGRGKKLAFFGLRNIWTAPVIELIIILKHL